MAAFALLTRLIGGTHTQQRAVFGLRLVLKTTTTTATTNNFGLHLRCLSGGLSGGLLGSSSDRRNVGMGVSVDASAGYTSLTKCRSYARLSTKSSPHSANKTDTKASSTAAADLFGDAANKGLFAKFRHMYKQYWYVLIPVHVLTSVGWFGGFYYLSKSGVDVPSLLQYIHLSETIIEKVQGSDMGHYAIAYLCYKVATPLRYALTLGCTTVSIKYLVQAGHIKPLPSKRELIQMYEDKKAATRTSSSTSSKTDKVEKDENHK